MLYEKDKDTICGKDLNKRQKMTDEQVTVQKICLFETFSHRKYYSFVMNESNLSAEQRSRLWHWRLGHPSHASHYYMNKRGNVKYQGPCKCLNEDCVVCDKSKFKSASFERLSQYKEPRRCKKQRIEKVIQMIQTQINF